MHLFAITWLNSDETAGYVIFRKVVSAADVVSAVYAVGVAPMFVIKVERIG